jgi:hypothetical protein
MLELADEMDNEARGWLKANGDPSDMSNLLNGYAKQIRMLVKASGPELPDPTRLYHTEAGRQPTEAAREYKRMGEVIEAHSENMHQFVGGPMEGWMPLSGDYPPGAKTLLSGSVYIRREKENIWDFSEEQTIKYRERGKS